MTELVKGDIKTAHCYYYTCTIFHMLMMKQEILSMLGATQNTRKTQTKPLEVKVQCLTQETHRVILTSNQKL